MKVIETLLKASLGPRHKLLSILNGMSGAMEQGVGGL